MSEVGVSLGLTDAIIEIVSLNLTWHFFVSPMSHLLVKILLEILEVAMSWSVRAMTTMALARSMASNWYFDVSMLDGGALFVLAEE